MTSSLAQKATARATPATQHSCPQPLPACQPTWRSRHSSSRCSSSLRLPLPACQPTWRSRHSSSRCSSSLQRPPPRPSTRQRLLACRPTWCSMEQACPAWHHQRQAQAQETHSRPSWARLYIQQYPATQVPCVSAALSQLLTNDQFQAVLCFALHASPQVCLSARSCDTLAYTVRSCFEANEA